MDIIQVQILFFIHISTSSVATCMYKRTIFIYPSTDTVQVRTIIKSCRFKKIKEIFHFHLRTHICTIVSWSPNKHTYVHILDMTFFSHVPAIHTYTNL